MSKQKNGTKAKTGRPLITLSEKEIKQVFLLGRQGMTIEQISDFLGFNRGSFYNIMERDERVFQQYKKGQGHLAHFCTGKLFDFIENGNAIALIFLIKARLGWRENSPMTFTDENNEVKEIKLTFTKHGDKKKKKTEEND